MSDDMPIFVKFNAREIPVREARLTVIWPLAYRPSNSSTEPHAVDRAISEIAASVDRNVWTPVLDTIEHIARPARSEYPQGLKGDAPFRVATLEWENQSYAEFVYFHDFVQSFLYQRKEEPQQLSNATPPFHLFRRTDVCSATVAWKAPGQDHAALDLSIARMNLYLFRTGAAIFVAEFVTMPRVGETRSPSLAEIQDLHDLFRRAYTPFFISGAPTMERQPGLVVDSVVWRDSSGKLLFGKDQKGFSTADSAVHVADILGTGESGTSRRHPPVFDHWRVLLPGVMRLTDDGSNALGTWRHVVDERMPTLLSVSVTPPDNEPAAAGARPMSMREPAFKAIKDPLKYYWRIGRSDFIRLCFADMSGNGNYPADKRLFENFDRDNVYDRYRSWGTRFLVSGYAFVAVGAGYDFDRHVMMHMRRHYFQMALLAHLEFATLLSMSNLITCAVAEQEKKRNDAQFERVMTSIQGDFLQFVHRFRFTGVSSQLQGREIFELLRQKLGLDVLFADVLKEIETGTAYLRNRAQAIATDAQVRLSLIATIGLALGLPLALLGSSFLMAENWIKDLYRVGPSEAPRRFAEAAQALIMRGDSVGISKSVAEAADAWLNPPSLTVWMRFDLASVLLGATLVAGSALLSWSQNHYGVKSSTAATKNDHYTSRIEQIQRLFFRLGGGLAIAAIALGFVLAQH